MTLLLLGAAGGGGKAAAVASSCLVLARSSGSRARPLRKLRAHRSALATRPPLSSPSLAMLSTTAAAPQQSTETPQGPPAAADSPGAATKDKPPPGVPLGQESVRVFSLQGMHKKQDQPLELKAAQLIRDPKASFAFYDRNFITAVRAMQDFLLSPDDLRDLRVTSRRSPNEIDPPIKVYWRKDIEAKARAVWGSLESLEREKDRRKTLEEKKISSVISRILSRSRDRRPNKKAAAARREKLSWKQRLSVDGLESHSGKVVLTAVAINFANFAGKTIAFIFTGEQMVKKLSGSF